MMGHLIRDLMEPFNWPLFIASGVHNGRDDRPVHMAGMEAEAMRLLLKRFMWRAWISGVAIGVIIAPFTVWPLFPDMPGWVFTSLLLVAVVQCLGLGLYLSHVTEQRKR